MDAAGALCRCTGTGAPGTALSGLLAAVPAAPEPMSVRPLVRCPARQRAVPAPFCLAAVGMPCEDKLRLEADAGLDLGRCVSDVPSVHHCCAAGSSLHHDV